MKPVAILQHEAAQGPGVLWEHLQQQGIACELISPCQEGHAPVRAADYRGVVVLGSNHCANEQLRWIEQERCLLQNALAHDVPVLGHCFGAQMLARAMGARVWRNPCPNIGWSNVWVTRQAQDLMQLPPRITLFNWHYDTFELPQGASRSMYGAFCLNKGFVHGRHWAFQGHLEVTEDSVRAWCSEGQDELRRAPGPAVQRAPQILAQLPQHLALLHATARRTYSAWAEQLDRPALFQLGALPGAPATATQPGRIQPGPELTLQYQAPLAQQTKAILARAVG
ncbi:type 1 glutamine amidotransferase [Comamonas sp. CMM03]|uniref:type 1 glutamine amidotransferase n=1 Tax=Comamonas sp. CMM03 TaxID=2854781 RepID=UPI001C44FEAF|nr:type 1 glutamine amidotransferase [Comamonas sp. CMM03]MBV7418097.1 type 1 glutamine amidotransferase [Comamonas sp. CMM03]